MTVSRELKSTRSRKKTKSSEKDRLLRMVEGAMRVDSEDGLWTGCGQVGGPVPLRQGTMDWDGGSGDDLRTGKRGAGARTGWVGRRRFPRQLSYLES